MGGHEMMGGPGMYAMMFWMPLGMLLFVALVVGAVWLVTRWLNPKQTPTMPYTPQSHDSYQSYERGYQPLRRMPETSRDPQPKQEYDQPPGEYPQEQEMPWQR